MRRRTRKLLRRFILIGGFAVLGACGSAHGPEPAQLPEGTTVVHMDPNAFSPDEVRIRNGETVTFVNRGAHTLHVLIPGSNAKATVQPGAARLGDSGGRRIEPDRWWTTPEWRTDGAFRITCTLHPDMNVDLRVS